MPADVSSWEQVEATAAELRDRLGPADVVVANAGILAPGSTWWTSIRPTGSA